MTKTKKYKRSKRQLDHVVSGRNYWEMNLSELLAEVDKLFPCYEKKDCYSYNYELAKFPVTYGWCFNVINDWHKWMDKKLKTHFGGYLLPEYAVAGFLDYVKQKKINVRRLISSR